MKKRNEQQEPNFLNKTQQVLYQREFKRADKHYHDAKNRGNQS